MELTHQILDDGDLLSDWIDGQQRVLADVARHPAERVYAGCSLAWLATIDTDVEPEWGSLPPDLPTDLVAAWTVAFDEREPDERRIAAAQDLLQGVGDAALTAEGAEILRRELGA